MAAYRGFNANRFLLAAIVDLFLLCCFWMVLGSLFAGLWWGLIEFGQLGDPNSFVNTLTGVALFFVAPWYIYFFVIFRSSGQTLGMRLLKLKVIPLSGEKLAFWSVFNWGFTLSTPLSILCALVVVSGPPYITHVERHTDTRIIEI
jgi:uncharacterized RDD family membrane protein YckC